MNARSCLKAAGSQQFAGQAVADPDEIRAALAATRGVRTITMMKFAAIPLFQRACGESVLAHRAARIAQVSPVYDKYRIILDRYELSASSIERLLARALDERLRHFPMGNKTLIELHGPKDLAVEVTPYDSYEPDAVCVTFPISIQPRPQPLLISICSKVRHAPRWRALRSALSGTAQIISSWIDQDLPGQSYMPDLWSTTLHECANAFGGILFTEEGETMKDALAEAGALLSHGHPVVWVGPRKGFTLAEHPNVYHADTEGEAVELLIELYKREQAMRRPTQPCTFLSKPGRVLRLEVDEEAARMALGCAPIPLPAFGKPPHVLHAIPRGADLLHPEWFYLRLHHVSQVGTRPVENGVDIKIRMGVYQGQNIEKPMTEIVSVITTTALNPFLQPEGLREELAQEVVRQNRELLEAIVERFGTAGLVNGESSK